MRTAIVTDANDSRAKKENCVHSQSVAMVWLGACIWLPLKSVKSDVTHFKDPSDTVTSEFNVNARTVLLFEYLPLAHLRCVRNRFNWIWSVKKC